MENVFVCLAARRKCHRGQKEIKSGEGEKVYPHGSRDQLGGPQSLGVGVR